MRYLRIMNAYSNSSKKYFMNFLSSYEKNEINYVNLKYKKKRLNLFAHLLSSFFKIAISEFMYKLRK